MCDSLGHPLAEREVITLHDLSGVDFFAYVAEDEARQRLDLIILEAGAAPPRIVVETISAATVSRWCRRASAPA